MHILPPTKQPTSPHPMLNLGFRIFFSSGAVFAALIMTLWAFVFTGNTRLDVSLINPFYWHAHEMLYGYAVAIIAGFMLTAVKTWTGVMMPYGWRLFVIFACWLLARIAWILIGFGGFGNTQATLVFAMVADISFMGLMAFYVFQAVLQVKQYKQMGLLVKIALLLLGNLLCYIGILMGDIVLNKIGIYLGLYLVIGVVLTIGRRVVPFFIERGVSFGQEVQAKVKNSALLDRLSLLSFIIFFIADVFYPNKYLITLSATSVAVVNLLRLKNWYHPGIWQKPLLWSLYLALLGMCFSFVLFAMQPWTSIAHSIPTHGLALSGIGMMTVAMMARVSLGHTGRNIHTPPKTVYLIFTLMVLVFVLRVLAPLVDMSHYMVWIMIAQTAWIACFVVFCISYIPILAAPREDGLFG